MAVGKNFLDNYSVFCVFGSVVGCVVVPLITQSVESLIFSAILISLTANRFSKKVVIEPAIKGDGKETKGIKGSKEKDMNLAVCKKKKKPPSNNNVNTQSAIYHQLSSSELRRQHKEEIERREYERLREQERKEEEKRERKLKKKEERQKRKNSEKKNCEVKSDKKISSYTTVTEKTTRSVSSPKAEERSRSVPNDRTTSSSMTHSSSSSTASANNLTCSPPAYMNNRTTKKYDYQRPNIPRFARQAAKARSHQFGYTTSPAAAAHASSPPATSTTTIIPPLSGGNGSVPWSRTTPSPPSPVVVNNPVPVATVSPTLASPTAPIIQPRVNSVIGCRAAAPTVSAAPEQQPMNNAKEQEKGGSNCYTLFGDSGESLLSIIRQETGLQHPV